MSYRNKDTKGKKGNSVSEEEINTGRIYHGEHFHGHKLYAHPTSTVLSEDEEEGAGNGLDKESLRLDKESLQHKGRRDPEQFHNAACPMPKWPANFKSAAFEAVSKKQSQILSPPEIYAEIAHLGAEKSKYDWYKLGVLAFLAGCYLSFGYSTALLISGTMNEAPSNSDKDEVNKGTFRALFGVFGFPFALTIIMIAGAELWTSMVTYSACALWEGNVSILTAIKMLFIVYFGNFMGCAMMVGLWIASGSYEGNQDYLVFSAEKKVRAGWGSIFVKGIFANWLVSLAVWQANAAQDAVGKATVILLTKSAFAALSLEHCVANMFIIPLAIYYGADVDAREFVWFSLIPSTFGNYVGRAIFVASSYAIVYGRTPVLCGNFLAQKLKLTQKRCRTVDAVH
ncbi:formate nitrite transporter [Dunaliella salina]|uniref:Formate nitrite transporter n=1 Tax=Dunaliella salina TaxID=3046 RepID=A0ABQ7G364_DUNSA|nr:formate nitrite transporter [Dunaliella salina]|eukprot:KAF5829045.1 formate nitrite transporter [Dunaliella salina]